MNSNKTLVHLFMTPIANHFPVLVMLPLLMVFGVMMHVFGQLFFRKFNGQKPPVVFHWFPFIGSTVSYGKDPIKFLTQCREQYGDIFTFVLLGRKLTVALGPKGNTFILHGNSSVFNAEDAYKHLTTPVFGKDVAYDAPSHVFTQQKRFLKFGLSVGNFRQYVGMIEDEVERYLESDAAYQGSLNSNHWDSFDITLVCEEITILTAARTLQGHEVRQNMDKSFSRLYHDLDGGFTPLNFLFPNLPLESYRKRDAAQKKMSNFYISIIKSRKANPSNSHEHDVITTLLNQKYRDGTQLKDHEVAHMMIGLLMAGQHTSATTGAWALLHLAADPKLAGSLYEEQLKYFMSPDGTLRSMTYDELEELPLLNAVLLETLRMHPPIHSFMRYVRDDVVIPSSTFRTACSLVVPRGHYVLASPAISQMDARIWDTPEAWNPYRWLNGGDSIDSKYSLHSGRAGDNSYLPFGTGKHRCIGEQFAFLQLGTIIVTILRRVELRLATKFPEPDYRSMITTPKKPSIVHYRRRIPGHQQDSR